MSFKRSQMVNLARFFVHDRRVDSSTIRTLTAVVRIIRHYHFNTNRNQAPKMPDSLASVHSTGRNIVAVFWDLDNKPPRSVSPFDAAVRLVTAAESFGDVRYKIAYANQHSFDYVPPEIREHRRNREALNQLENKGVVKPVDPYLCPVCGHKFYTNEKLIKHFKELHEREHKKRVSQIESARGSRRVKLVGKYSMKMEKYKYVARDILTPNVGYGLGDELERAGYSVNIVSNRPQAADIALRNHMVDMMDKRQMECLILVSDDCDFVKVLKEARLRCLKTVVVGDRYDGALKRVSDASFSWREIIMGPWKDGDILKRLEQKCNYETERKLYVSSSEDDDHNDDFGVGNLMFDEIGTDQNREWWKLESDSDVSSSS